MPKTYTTEIIGYEFEELSDSVKQKIYHQDYDDIAQMVDFEPLEDEFRSKLLENCFVDPGSVEMFYDLSYSQGSGASCTGEIDVDTLLTSLLKDAKCYDGRLSIDLGIVREKHERGVIHIDAIQIVRCGPSNFYNHEKTCRVEIEYSSDLALDGFDAHEQIVHLEEYLTEIVRDLLVSFHCNMQDYYEESTSFEAYCEVMSDNTTIFTKDGKVVDPVFIKAAHVFDGYQLALEF